MIEHPKCPTCSRDIQGYEDDGSDATLKAVPCGHHVTTEGLWVMQGERITLPDFP